MIRLVLLGLLCLGALALSSPRNMRVNDVISPLAVEVSVPRFSWVVDHSGRAQSQSAYRVVVSHDSNLIDEIWDSGIVKSIDTVAEYEGPSLERMRHYFWAVQWWDADGVASDLSEVDYFALAPDAVAWNASSWLDGGTMIRKDFTLAAAPNQAMAYIVGIGFFELYVNGQRIGAGEQLAGAWNTWTKRVLYHTFNVTLNAGANTIGVMLGAGWRDTTSFPPLGGGGPCESDFRLLRMMMVVDNVTVLNTDATWQGTSNGPVVNDSVYNGDTYDARLEMPGWNAPGYTPSSVWGPVQVMGPACFNPTLTPLTMPTITTALENSPVNIYPLPPLPGCPTGTIGGLVNENSNLVLTCDSGTIQSITFASFGTPDGACGAFKTGTCSSKNSMSVVQKLCVGKASCTIPATNTEFGGDPCYGTPKRLAVYASGCSATPSGPRWVADFGENLSGRCRIHVTGAAGTTVTLHHAEAKQHPPYGPVNGELYYANLRSALALDTYTLKGTGGQESYEAHFTYHGFQYVEVAGWPGNLTTGDITQVHFRTANAVRTTFNSSSSVLNAIQHNAVLGQGSNMMSIPTDCDQRDERLGWMGDAGLSSDSMALNFDVSAFQDNFLRNMEDELYSDGSLSDTVPWARYGGRPADPSWSAAFVQTSYVRWKIGGALATVAEHWAGMEAHMAFITAQVAKAGSLSAWKAPYGDWVPADPSTKVSNSLCAAYNYIVNTKQMAEMAGALGNPTAQAMYTALAANITAMFNRDFYHPLLKTWDNGAQSALAMALAAGAVQPSMVKDVVKTLVDNITSKYSNHVSVGIIGAKALFPVLTSNGEMDVAVSLAEQTTYPSWGYMIYNNVEPAPSSLWELWNSPTEGPGMDSRNHHMFSSISGWLVTSVGGISNVNCIDEPVFTAAPALGVTWAQTSVETPCGTMALKYTRTGGVQCAKVPESRSSSRPIAPVTPAATLSCGNEGGVITSVDFASWGMPEGGCGAFTVDNTCHHAAALKVAEDRCLGQDSCTLPNDADFWGDNACNIGDALKRLYVQVTCSGAHGVDVEATLPVGRSGVVSIPSYGAAPASVRVSESGTEIFHGSAGSMGSTEGVIDAKWAAAPAGSEAAGQRVLVRVASGTYSLRLSVV